MCLFIQHIYMPTVYRVLSGIKMVIVNEIDMILAFK